jgi:hypothetical protein
MREGKMQTHSLSSARLCKPPRCRYKPISVQELFST